MNLELNEVFSKLKASLIRNNCKIIAEEPLKIIEILQGSLWGTSPKTAQKKTQYRLRQNAQGTYIASTSSLTSGYINLTLSGVALSIGLMLLCIWIALDLQTYSLMGAQGFWGWLVQINGRVDSGVTASLIRLSWILATFLAATLVAESLVISWIRSRIDALAEEILKTL